MAKCDYCGASIIVGGIRDGDRLYCDADCRSNGRLDLAVPAAQAQEEVQRVHQGPCPKCGGPGPVDLHHSHRVWSIVVFSFFSSRQHLCCRWCATKAQLGAILFCGVLGWWGIPFGVIGTPIQIGRNIVDMFSAPNRSAPSAELERMIKLSLASQGIASDAIYRQGDRERGTGSNPRRS